MKTDRKPTGHPNSVLESLGKMSREQKIEFYKRDAASLGDLEAMNAWAQMGFISGSCLSTHASGVDDEYASESRK